MHSTATVAKCMNTHATSMITCALTHTHAVTHTQRLGQTHKQTRLNYSQMHPNGVLYMPFPLALRVLLSTVIPLRYAQQPASLWRACTDHCSGVVADPPPPRRHKIPPLQPGWIGGCRHRHGSLQMPTTWWRREGCWSLAGALPQQRMCRFARDEQHLTTVKSTEFTQPTDGSDTQTTSTHHVMHCFKPVRYLRS